MSTHHDRADRLVGGMSEDQARYLLRVLMGTVWTLADVPQMQVLSMSIDNHLRMFAAEIATGAGWVEGYKQWERQVAR